MAAQNLMLAAHAMGLGSCVIGSAATALNVMEIKDQLGIPADTTAIAPIIVGNRAANHIPVPEMSRKSWLGAR